MYIKKDIVKVRKEFAFLSAGRKETESRLDREKLVSSIPSSSRA